VVATPSEPSAQGGWQNLEAADEPAAVGCIVVLGAILLLVGGGILAVFFVHPAGKGDPWVMFVVGGAFFLVGAGLLWAAIRGARGRSIALAELSIQGALPLRAGDPARLRLRQPGPVTLESLTVKLGCRREYRRKVRPNSSSTVSDHEVLWEQVLLEVLDEGVPAGGVLEREASLTLPASAAPTGPGQPDGHVRWNLEVTGEAGFMRATHRAFPIVVERAPSGAGAGEAFAAGGGTARAEQWSAVFGPGESAPAGEAAEQVAGAQARQHDDDRTLSRGERRTGGLSFNAGCLVISVPCLLAGSFLLWAFFSGMAASGRGNPYMALVGGLLFGGVGLLGLVGILLSRADSRTGRTRGR